MKHFAVFYSVAAVITFNDSAVSNKQKTASCSCRSQNGTSQILAALIAPVGLPLSGEGAAE